MTEPVDFVVSRGTSPRFQRVAVKPVDGNDATDEKTCVSTGHETAIRELKYRNASLAVWVR